MGKEKNGTKRLEQRRDESIRQILDAAMEVFAESGYEGARVDEIARRSGMNKAMIYYRIGDKRRLYEEVIHYVFGDVVERISENIRDDLPPEDKYKVYISNLARTMAEHPSFPRIMMREVASGWTNFSEAMARDILGVLGLIRDIIDEGVKKGVFIDVNPFIAHMMSVGTMLLFILSMPVRKNFSYLLDEEIMIPKDASFEHIFSDLEKMMLRALKA